MLSFSIPIIATISYFSGEFSTPLPPDASGLTYSLAQPPQNAAPVSFCVQQDAHVFLHKIFNKNLFKDFDCLFVL